LGWPPFRVDVLTSIQGVDFPAAYARRKILQADGLELPFVGLNDLPVNKRAVGRFHDLDDTADLTVVLGRNIKKTKSASPGKPKKRDAHRKKG
jgi:hypothetical protein